MTIVCLGEGVVDLICPEPLDDPAEARSFEARFGGALANVAVAARRAGAPAALAGGVGDDPWGRLIRTRLTDEGVDVSRLVTIAGMATPFAFVTFDRSLEPSFRIHGAGIEAGIQALADRLEQVLGDATALVFGSNTLPDEPAREVTLAAKRRALQAGLPVLFDPNLRPGRWRDLARARTLCLGAIEGISLLKANLVEARWLAGEPELDASAAAERLAGLGCELAVVTDGARPVAARGEAAAGAEPPAVRIVSPLGAGDAFMGTLAGAMHTRGWAASGIGEALEAAVVAAAEACTRLGAID